MGLSFVNWVYRFKVSYSDMISAFGYVRDRFRAWISDNNWAGIVYDPINDAARQLKITQNSPTPDLTVKCEEGRAYTKQGQRILRISSADTINCALDKNGAATIPSVGNERYISIFIVPKFKESIPGTDGNGVGYNLLHEVDHVFEVEAGAEAPIGNAVQPALRGDAVLLAEILLGNATTQIIDSATPYTTASVGEISYSRREEWDAYSNYRGLNLSARGSLDVRRNRGNVAAFSGTKFYAEAVPRSWISTVGSTGAIIDSYNIVSISRVATGKYDITLPTGLFGSVSDIIPLVTNRDSATGVIPQEVRAWPASPTVVRVEIVGDVSGSWAYKDANFSLVIFGRPIADF